MKARLKQVPLKPGVYMFKSAVGEVIYVGKAKVLRHRLRSYFQNRENLEVKVRALMNRVADFDYIVTNTELEAFILENNLIKSYQPRYNIQLRDDKSYPYLKLSVSEQFPRLSVVRERRDKESRYFGPYANVYALRQTMRMLGKIFPLRTCKNLRNRRRPCLQYDMRLCLAPCVAYTTEEEYQRVVEALLAFLEDGGKNFIKAQEQEMEQAAQRFDFEKAARLRDQIRALKKWREHQQIDISSSNKIDVIGIIGEGREFLLLNFQIRQGRIVAKDTFWLKSSVGETPEQLLVFFIKNFYNESRDLPEEIVLTILPEEQELLSDWMQELAGFKVRLFTPQRGEKKSLLDMVQKNTELLWEEKTRTIKAAEASLQALAEVLNLESSPVRIEGYDISHFSGEETVGSMVVFTNGQMDKKAYRRFKLTRDQNDDYASHKEVLQRRLQELSKENPAFLPAPDLIVIDGGAGQLHVARQVLVAEGYDIAVCSLAEKYEEIYLPGKSEPLKLSLRHEGLNLLRRVRDEAHRFALQYSRRRKGNKFRNSVLDNIKGIGPKRKAELLKKFGSVKKISSATYEELRTTPGLHAETARNVWEYFQQEKETEISE